MSTIVSSLQAIFSADTSDLESGLSSAEGRITGFGNSLSNVGAKLSGFGAQLGAVAAPAVMAATVAASSFMGFNESLTNANSILQLTEDQIGAVSDQILAMGTDALAGPQAVADSYYDIVSGVTDATTHMDILATSIAVSEAGASDLQGTTAALVGTMNAYGFAAEDAAFAGDVFTRITGMGVGTLDEFGAALPRVTGLASSLGIGFDDLGAQMSFITTKGYSASQAATMLQASMTALINPNETMIKAFNELGVANGEALISMYGLDGAMQAVAGTSIVAEDGLAKTLGSVEALNGVLVLTQDGAQDFFDTFSGGSIALHDSLEIINNMKWGAEQIGKGWNNKTNLAGITAIAEEMQYLADSTESYTDAARRVQRASPAAQFKLMKAEVAGLAIQVGAALVPALFDLWSEMQPVVTQIIGWVSENPELVSQIAMVALGAGALAGVLVPLGMAITLIGSTIVALGAILPVVAAGFALMVSPIGLVVLAIGALGIAYKTNFLGFADAVDDVAANVAGLARTARTGFSAIAKNIESKALPAIEDLWVKAQGLPSIFDGLKNIDMGSIFGEITDKLSNFISGWRMTNEQLGVFADYMRIAGVAIGLFIPYVGLLIAIGTALYTAYQINFLGFADIVDSAVPIVGDALNQIIGFFTGFVDSLRAGNIGSFVQDSIIAPLIAGLSGFLTGTDLQATASGIGASVLGALASGLDMVGKGATWINDNLITPLINQASGFVSSGGLKDLMYNMGKGLTDALQIGVVLLGNIGAFIATNVIAPLASSVAQYVSSGQLWEDLKTFGSNIPQYIKDGLSALIAVNTFFNDQIVSPFVQGVWDSLSGGILWSSLKLFGTSIINSIKDAITTGIPNFIADNIVNPLSDMVTTTDWGGVIGGVADKGVEIAESLGTALIDGIGTLAGDFQQAINNLIPDKVTIRLPAVEKFGVTVWGGGEVSIGIPNPFMEGTPWTGNMPRTSPAGIVHGQEAVIPTGGMMARVVPSPGGLMVQGGGGRGGGMTINGDVHVHGVENVARFYDELEKEGKRRSVSVGVW